MTQSASPAARSGTLLLGGELPVNRMGFGAMRLTGRGIWGPPRDRRAAIEVLRRAVGLGVNLIDTADSYGPHVNEELIAEALHPYRQGLVIATKAGLTRPGPDEWRRNARPEHLRAACEGSLQRLRLERIDLYQLHAPDPEVPFEDSVGELARLQAEGKIRFIGLSNVGPDELAKAQRLVRVVSVQNRYNLEDRKWESMVDLCERQGIAFLPWYPLAAGPLTEARGRLERVAARLGATPAQVALAWLLHRSPVMLPIPGTSSIAHLEENVAAAALSLSAEDLRELAG
ncbi:MAG: aldo/keto reductase [Pseudomonadota bacterium]|jgi:Predicted oxidoreductases (related to aryl-alcohol dehydrogenases)|nr:MAG: oxidoreductase [Pseudomonadota bacterium]